jgi:hypothetical protein
MVGVLRFLAMSVVATLPRQFRDRWEWAAEAGLRGPAMLSGLAEGVVSLMLVILRYFAFFEHRLGTIADAALKRPNGDEVLAVPAVQFGAGFTTLVEYGFHPLTLLLIYFTIEGALRFFAALVTEECAGTMPLYVLAGGVDRARAAWKEHELGPPVPDELQFCTGIGYDLCIASCRPKPGWNDLVTVEYLDQLYELHDKKMGAPPRPYLYLLRKLSPYRMVRGLHHYHPDEALTEKQRRALAKQAAPKP